MYNHKIPHYFAHKMRHEMVELYASVMIANFALAMVTLFEPIYFVAVLGWSISKVLIFFAAVYALYIVLIPLGAKITAQYGPAKAILFSIPFQIGYWLFLFGSGGSALFPLLAVVCFAIQKSLYWPAFHTDVANFSHPDQRSREFSGMSAWIHIIFIIGPFVGGWVSQKFGVQAPLALASVIYFTMFIPLFTHSERVIKRTYSYAKTLSYYRKYPLDGLTYLGYGEELIFFVVWPLFIYHLLPNFFSLGSVVAMTTLVATLLVLAVGKAVDGGHRRGVLFAGTFFAVLSWVVKAMASSLSHLIWGDSISRASRDSLYILLASSVYERATSEDVLAYVVYFEQVLSIGKLVAALLGILLFSLTGQIYPILVLGGLYTLFYLFLPLRRSNLLGGAILKSRV